MIRRRSLVALALAAVLAGACGKKEEPPPPAAAPVKDIFTELLETVRQNPQDVDSWMHLADLYERGKSFEKELEALHKVLELDPGRTFAHLKLGNTFNRLERYQEAVASFLEAKKARPDDPVLYNNLAFAYGKLGRPADQIAALRKAVSLRPRYATARLNLGTALAKSGDRAGGEEQYKALLEFDEAAAVALREALDGAKRP